MIMANYFNHIIEIRDQLRSAMVGVDLWILLNL